jgi:Zn-dependent protease with chaperone function
MIDLPRRHPAATVIIGGLVIAHGAWSAGMAVCPRVDMVECLLTANLLVLAGSLIGLLARAVWLGVGAGRAVAALVRAPISAELEELARKAGVRALRHVEGTDVTAFCAGLMRPRVYVTTMAVAALDQPQLAAVLAHEAEHARRRDPLRRLLSRAASDALFYVPLAGWWSRRLHERAEVGADRAAIRHAGRRAVAGALMAADAGAVMAPAFNGATQARVAQLLGDDLPLRRPSRKQVVASVLGLVGAVWLMMCVGQTVLAPLLL